MKQVLIVFDAGVLPDIMRVLEELGLDRWTQLPEARGSGERHTREGTPIWPGLNALLLLVVPPEKVQPLIARCHEVRDTFPLKPGMRFIVSDCEIY
jgi:hypothetical protein